MGYDSEFGRRAREKSQAINFASLKWQLMLPSGTGRMPLHIYPYRRTMSIFLFFPIYSKSMERRNLICDANQWTMDCTPLRQCGIIRNAKMFFSLLFSSFISFTFFPVVCCSFRILIHTRGDTALQAEMDFLISPKCHLNLCICHLGIVYFADANDANNPRCGSGAAEIWKKKRENDRPGRLPTTPGHLICIFGCSACCALCDCQKEPWKNTCQRTTIYVISDLN